MMDQIFKGTRGVLWYLDNILIHGGQTEAKHQKIVQQVLKKCLDHGLAVNLEKSEFHKNEVKFLGHVINGVEIKMQVEKVNII